MAASAPGQHATCNICMEPMAPTEAHRGSAACAHAFCRACLAGHVRAKVESSSSTGGNAVVRCPDASCAAALDAELCRTALPSDVFERWCAALCAALFAGARRTYCPFPDCSELMVADEGDAEGSVTQSECQVCRRLFCARCRVAPWHIGLTCDEYGRFGKGGSSAREDAMLLEMAAGRKWKRCPSCQFVEKTEGCRHITCRCGFPSVPSSRTSIPDTLVFCKICMDGVPAGDAHRASRGCAHAFCGGCLEGYIGAKIQERIADVRCPEERCGGVLDPELCQGFIPGEVFERWGAALCESMVLGAKKVYCPYKDCSAMMLVDGDAGDVIEESECPSCRRLFCARCGVAPWHAGVSCAEYRKFGKGTDSRREDLLLLQMAKGKKWKRCPKCDFFVEKSDGCLHITCRCGFEFCYGCGNKWGTTHSSCSAA